MSDEKTAPAGKYQILHRGGFWLPRDDGSSTWMNVNEQHDLSEAEAAFVTGGPVLARLLPQREVQRPPNQPTGGPPGPPTR